MKISKKLLLKILCFKMKKLLGIIVLGLLLSGNICLAGQKIIYLGDSTLKLSRADSSKYVTYNFYENGTCQVSWVDWWTYTENNCRWEQEGPKIKINWGKKWEINVNGYLKDDWFKGRIQFGNGYTTTLSGLFDYYSKVYKNWISPEEKQRIADEKKRQERQKELQRKANEKKRLAEEKKIVEANKNNAQSNTKSASREKAKKIMLYKGESAINGFLGGLIGMALGFGLYSIMDRKTKKKINDKYFLGAAFFIGWIISKFV